MTIDVETRIVAQWATIYDAVYTTDGSNDEPDFAGWRSSITGENYTAAETAEWLDGTVSGVRDLLPASGPRRVLDVGAGSGLVVRELVSTVDSYVAVDISATAVERMRRTYGARPGTRFLVRAADEIADLGPADSPFDVVVFNSVIHHFPGVEYLRRVIAGAAAAGRTVFLGDVHSLPLRDALRLCALAVRAPGPLTAGRIRTWLDGQHARERELVLDPGFFVDVAAEHGLVADVRLKPGRHGTEMNLVRYDVRLLAPTGRILDPATLPKIPWPGGFERTPHVLTGVPHPGLTPSVRALETVRRLDSAEPVDVTALVGSPGEGVAPADLRAEAERHGLTCYCVPSTVPGRYDAVVAPGRWDGVAWTTPPPDGRPAANEPAAQH
jgi:SAM-dependent methyltransferase